jgi:hypothetical protein
MHTQGEGVVAAVHDVTERAKSLVRLEIELALLELRGKFASLGAGVGLLIASAVLVLFAVGFLLAAAAAGFATALPVWLSILIV